ncbi:hypothetical protein K457DRAFT_1901602 [Linnemannia elongata AG-77]|uniref:F-box domain-containing protein n=1 Tax=Linnemannia elongata AG-77 TaxID=1314771 RepID=A0A197KGZ7_9FUNG|nr:hypothetical protein K457DRAFT_1901602 [Linnemannia elongata AG-77]
MKEEEQRGKDNIRESKEEKKLRRGSDEEGKQKEKLNKRSNEGDNATAWVKGYHRKTTSISISICTNVQRMSRRKSEQKENVTEENKCIRESETDMKPAKIKSTSTSTTFRFLALATADHILTNHCRRILTMTQTQTLRRHEPKACGNQTPPPQNVTTPLVHQLHKAPLDIPEILQLIFAYLDDHTICRSAAPVCRLWHILNQNRYVREDTWNPDWTPARKERVARKLNGAGLLHCHLAANRAQEFADDNKYAIRKMLRSLEERELVLEISFYAGQWIDGFPFSTSLSNLSIRIEYLHDSEILGSLLRRCPRFEHFSVETQSIPGVTLKWIDPFNSSTTATTTTTTTAHLHPLRLRSLTLWSIDFAQVDLENLLAHMPNLEDLKLKGMIWSGSTGYNWTRPFQFLRTNNITLDSAHFSSHGIAMSTKETDLFFTNVFSSRSSERTLWALYVIPELLQRAFLQPATTTLTTLELYWSLASNHVSRACCAADLADAPGLLHQLLCDSDLLVYLTTLKTAVRREGRNLFSRGGYIDIFEDISKLLVDRLLVDPPSATTPLPHPTIRRCRSLRTLHINLHAPVHHRLQHPVHARIFFGYISRVCPLLEHLQLHVPPECQSRVDQGFYRTNFHLGLDGGLVLLGRLQSLRSLRMWQSGNASSNSNSRGGGGGSIYAVKTEAENLSQLQNLGLLLDVEEKLQEMDMDKNFRPLPALEKLSFSLPIMRRPEDELRSLFSSAFKRWRRQ